MVHGHEIPPRAKPADDSGYLEMLTKAVFQAGFSWQVIRQKWPDFQRAFEGFNVQRVAAYGDAVLERLLDDPGIVRNRRKVMATIENARTLVDLADEHGSFHGYLRTLDSLPYAQKRKLLVDQFVNLGPTGLFVFLWLVDEPVPDWEERNS